MAKICFLATGGTVSEAWDPVKESLVPIGNIDNLIDELKRRYDLDHDLGAEEIIREDSSNLSPEHHVLIGQKIVEKSKEVGGIVLTHGTDTMTFTLSRLYHGLKNCPVPVVLTGSQVPPEERNTDVFENLRYAIEIVEEGFDQPAIAFANNTYYAETVEKISTFDRRAFGNLDKRKTKPFRKLDKKSEEPFFDKSYSRRVERYALKVGLNKKALEALLEESDGLVLEGFGAGNGSTELMEFLKKYLSDVPKPVVLSSRPWGPTDQTVYGTGKQFIETTFADKDGRQTPLVATSGDWRPEFCLVRLSYILGHEEIADFPVRKIQEIFLSGAQVRNREKYEQITGLRIYPSDLLQDKSFERVLKTGKVYSG